MKIQNNTCYEEIIDEKKRKGYMKIRTNKRTGRAGP